MKKLISYSLLIIMIFSISFTVNAQDYQKNTLIPVDTIATVKTEKFDYLDFTYRSAVDAKGNTLISFGSILNNTVTKNAVSVNILLFGEDQKNIGFLTYCSDKDVSSNYAGFKLTGNQSAPFAIDVTSRYFVEGKGPKDVKFIAVMDENKYCQIGGYDKYKGLTIDKIDKGDVKEENEKKPAFDIIEFFQNSDIMPIVLGVVIGLVALVVIGSILNALHKRMYAKTTTLAYLPITNFYITAKMAFGNIVALVFGVLVILSGLLYYLNITFLAYFSGFIFIVAFLVVLIKLVTKKYDLFYFEPAIKTSTFQIDNSTPKEEVVEDTPKETTNFIEPSAQQTIDLNYDDVEEEEVKEEVNVSAASDSLFNVSSSDIQNVENSESNETSSEDTVNSLLGTGEGLDTGDGTTNNTDTSDKGESDLSKFFN